MGIFFVIGLKRLFYLFVSLQSVLSPTNSKPSLSKKPIELTIHNFDEYANMGPLFVDIYATWCKHC